MTWNVISGVSVGAINGSLLSVFPVREEVAALHSMIELWGNIVQQYIYDDGSMELLRSFHERSF